MNSSNMTECFSNNLAMVMVTGNNINPPLPYHCQADCFDSELNCSNYDNTTTSENNRIVTAESIPPTSTYQETSTPSESVGHSYGVQQIQEEKRIKEDDLETEKLLQDIMLDFIISPYTTTNSSRKRIPISPHLSELVHEFVQDLGNKIMPAANAFDKIYIISKKNFPSNYFLKIERN
jgi:hypothetical protein